MTRTQPRPSRSLALLVAMVAMAAGPAGCSSPGGKHGPGADGGVDDGGGVLVCAGSLSDCNGTCVFLQSDPANCGTCSHTCTGSQICSSGACVPGGCMAAGASCPVETYCDPDTRACTIGCNADSQCRGPWQTTCDVASSTCQCKPGYHPCGINCRSDTDPVCGAGCCSPLLVSQIFAGSGSTCAVTTAGGAKCWGYNGAGQVGNGTTTRTLAAADVSGLTSGVASVAGGDGFACAVTTAGGLKCWGGGGLLGDGSTAQSSVPVDVTGLASGVQAIALGSSFGCALTTGGGVECWGDNSSGQLGDGTNTPRLTPVGVVGLGSGVSAIAAGGSEACAILASGGLQCWGRNFSGQLGNGTTADASTPVDVSGLASGVAQVSVGDEHACAVTTAGAAKCWGGNANGALGDGSTTDSAVPVSVSGLSSGVDSTTAMYESSCALTTAGAVKCWGNNEFAELGDGTPTTSLTPVDVVSLGSGVAAVTAGGFHACVRTTANAALCWGYDKDGELGNGIRLVYSATPDSVVVP